MHFETNDSALRNYQKKKEEKWNKYFTSLRAAHCLKFLICNL